MGSHLPEGLHQRTSVRRAGVGREMTIRKQKRPEIGSAGGRPAATILVIDDESGLRALIRDILERDGHQVITAENGNVGIQRFQECLPDIVVTDLCMPDMDGLRVIQEISRLAPETQIVAISGGGRDGMDVLRKAKEAGASAVLQKPFRKAALLSALRP